MRVGSRVGNYVLGDPIGAGGMGVVYDADDGTRRVAIKLLYRETLIDDRAVRRFRNEALAGRIVSHPNVVGVIERGETEDGIPYLVMEQARGERLAERIDRDGPVSIRTALEIVQQVLAGLDAIHGAGVVHGDIKADNILVETRPDGSVAAKLVDFGLARVSFSLHDELDPGDLEIVSGTPDYMAPEVIVGDALTCLSDIYATGVVLYELVVGQTPYGGGTSDDIVQRHIDARLVLPSLRCCSYCPSIIDRIVGRAMQKEPSRRFASASVFANAIAVALRAQPPLSGPRPGSYV